jgi:hypothetical protein
MELKGLANELVQDFGFPLEQGEIVMLLAIVSFMDTFILKCLDAEGKLTNTIWIKSRLLEVLVVLNKNTRPEIKVILEKIKELQQAIIAGELISGRIKGNKGGYRYRPPFNRKKP